MVQNYENISRINSSIYLISVDDGFVILNDEDALQQSDVKLPPVLIRRVENITDKITTIAEQWQPWRYRNTLFAKQHPHILFTAILPAGKNKVSVLPGGLFAAMVGLEHADAKGIYQP